MGLAENLKTGLRGEQLTARELISRGHSIITANFHTYLGETDIISEDENGTVCFTEVKTRSPGGMFPPADAVDVEKQKKLINNAAAFLKIMHMQDRKIRFDISEVILHDLFTADINIIENAFQADIYSAVE